MDLSVLLKVGLRIQARTLTLRAASTRASRTNACAGGVPDNQPLVFLQHWRVHLPQN